MEAKKQINAQAGCIWLGAASIFLIIEALLQNLDKAPALRIGLLAATGVLMLIGLVRGFPKWLLPLFGAGLAILFFYLVFMMIGPFFLWIKNSVLPPTGEWRRYAYNAIQSGFLWLGLWLLAWLLIWLIKASREKFPFYKDMDIDWTSISYTLYGSVLFSMLINFDDYQHEQVWQAIFLLFIVLGAWGYLREKKPLRKLGWLMAGSALAMGVMALAKWYLVPLQDWEVWFSRHPAENERWFESGRTLIELGWLLLALALPAIPTITRKEEPALPKAESGVGA